MNIFFEINKNISEWLNSFIVNNNLEKFVWFFADFPIFFLPIFLLSYWLFYTYKIQNNNKSNLLNIFSSIILAIFINLMIQQIVQIDRPESIVKPILQHIPDASFPSDHATVSFAFLAWLFLAWYKRTFYTFSIFVILMNFLRIGWWIHWFFDIVAWAIIWILSSVFIFKYLKNTKIIKQINNFIIKTMGKMKL